MSCTSKLSCANEITPLVSSSLSSTTTTVDSAADFLYDKTPNQDPEASQTVEHNNRSRLETRSSHKTTVTLLSWLISSIGIVACSLILTQGITAEWQSKQAEFERVARDIVFQFELEIEDYVQAGLWLHEMCFDYHDHDGSTTLISHEKFEKHVYPAFLQSNARAAHPISIIVNTSHAERENAEKATRTYLKKQNTSFEYMGLKRWHEDEDDGVNDLVHNSTVEFEPQPNQAFYMWVRLVAPLFQEDSSQAYENEDMIDLDLDNFPFFPNSFAKAIETKKPNLRAPFCFDMPPGESPTFSCTFDILHPGARRDSQRSADDKDANRFKDQESVSDIGVWVNDLFTNVNAKNANRDIRLYLFDNMVEESAAYESMVGSPLQPMMIGAAQLGQKLQHTLFEGTPEMPSYLPYSNKSSVAVAVQEYTYHIQVDIDIHNRNWSFVFVATREDFPPHTRYIMLGASVILMACLGLTMWVQTDHHRRRKMQILQEVAKAEKAALMVENARLTARKERELNDFIAHEVRNPISAALSACSFLTTAVQEGSSNNVSWTHDKRKVIEEDVKIIDSSLNFINDLLRNMLDLHRTQSKQLKLNPTPLSVYSDILQPVAAMLRQHGQPFSVLVECNPPDLVIQADKLRLKQIVLNLGRNSVKFVTKGYVRLKAQISEENGMVELLVQDSGPGIPTEKRSRLFSKFQESLDSLHQGTGIGLSLCQMLIDLMGGEIKLDDRYDSGIAGFPGASFQIKLNTPPLTMLPEEAGKTQRFDLFPSAEASAQVTLPEEKNDKHHITNGSNGSSSIALPVNLSVLICDDDLMLRKMFIRSLKRVAPSWELSEASNGETGLQMAMKTDFDMIFLDQYMASVSKQMLGTETAMAMRTAGIKSVLCGLSANDMEKSFLSAGANSFMMKPFPCNPGPLREALAKVVQHLPKKEEPVQHLPAG